MIVPQYWAEARVQQQHNGRQVTLRRFGWSDESQEAAEANAGQRCQEAMRQLLSGADVERREPKTAYNGAIGVPIREEVISRHGETVITRNSYGALCLNTPNVLFVDIDFPEAPPFRFTLSVFAGLALCSGAAGFWLHSFSAAAILTILSMLFCSSVAGELYRLLLNFQGGMERLALERIGRFLEQRPNWNFRIYKSPAGVRAVATHRTFDADDPEVENCFNELKADPMYALMCRNQKCFRARVSPKPWRIGISDHMRPRPGHWPVAPERIPLRQAWISKYEKASQGFAACSHMKNLGSGFVNPDVAPVLQLHDHLSGAESGLPTA